MRAEVERLRKMVEALMNRAERSTSAQGSDFGLFQTAVTLEERVRRRTEDLEAALHENEKINRALHQAQQQMEGEIFERRRMQEALRQSEERYRAATDAALDAFITIDDANRIVFVNSAVSAIFGYARDELIGRDFSVLLPADAAGRGGNMHAALARGRGGVPARGIEMTCVRKDGRTVPVEISFGRFEQNGRRFYTGVARDITERRRAEALREGQQRVLELIALDRPLEESLALLLRCIEQQVDGMRGCVLLLEDGGNCVAEGIAPTLDADYVAALRGLEIGPTRGSCGSAMFRREPVIVSDIAQDPLWEENRALALQYGLRACWSTPIISGAGQVLGSFAMYYETVRAPQEHEMRLVDLAVRIAGIAIERRRHEAYISHMAHHDSLTGLPNRMLLEDRLRQAIAQAGRRDGRVALLFIDLDHFKHINDSLGHHIGDRLLHEAARAMARCLREGDSVARLGGDEFVICIADVHQSSDAASVAQKIQETLSRPFDIEGHTLQVGCSIGIALYPLDGSEVAELMKAADAAMYEAKSRGRGNYQFYTRELNVAAQQRAVVSNQLRQALARGELSVHYQPQISIATGAIVGVEALLRWHHPQMGMVPPAHFIGLLEEMGLMGEIGKWVLQTACAQNRAWQKMGLPPVRMAVNLSARQFFGADIVGTVTQVLQETGLAPNWLDLEITESLILDNSEHVIDAMRRLKAMGVGLALDDFGTGYSSLSYLRRFPVTRLKIDRSFVADIVADGGSADIVRSILVLAQKFGLSVVAEGVETEVQLGYLQREGCAEMQGYFYSPPLAPDDMERLLRSDRRLPVWSSISRAANTVLIVDDDPDVLAALEMGLQEEGYDVLAAGSMADALALLAKNEVGAVLTDLWMPGGDGIRLLSQVRVLFPDVIRMLLTGSADIGAMVDAINRGAIYKIVMKPWKHAALVDAVRDALGSFVARKERAHAIEPA